MSGRLCAAYSAGYASITRPRARLKWPIDQRRYLESRNQGGVATVRRIIVEDTYRSSSRLTKANGRMVNPPIPTWPGLRGLGCQCRGASCSSGSTVCSVCSVCIAHWYHAPRPVPGRPTLLSQQSRRWCSPQGLFCILMTAGALYRLVCSLLSRCSPTSIVLRAQLRAQTARSYSHNGRPATPVRGDDCGHEKSAGTE